ncbi:MAG: hypothetical protein GYB20_03530 [Oceanospirillales bacterium]|nr:hypothetical protein [Oceanospirillales bacterium]MBR9886761.1 hypothetical protein [Oceanospirillales bacterium]
MFEVIATIIKSGMLLLFIVPFIYGIYRFIRWRFKRNRYMSRIRWAIGSGIFFTGRLVASLLIVLSLTLFWGPRSYLVYSDTYIQSSAELGRAAVFAWRQNPVLPGLVSPVFLSENYKVRLKPPGNEILDKYAAEYPWRQVLPWYQHYIFGLSLLFLVLFKMLRRKAGISFWRAAQRVPSLARYRTFLTANHKSRFGRIMLRERRKAKTALALYRDASIVMLQLLQYQLGVLIKDKDSSVIRLNRLLQACLKNNQTEIGITLKTLPFIKDAAEARYKALVESGRLKEEALNLPPSNFLDMLSEAADQGVKSYVNHMVVSDLFGFSKSENPDGLTLEITLLPVPSGVQRDSESGRYAYISFELSVMVECHWKGSTVFRFTSRSDNNPESDAPRSPFLNSPDKFYAHSAAQLTTTALSDLFSIREANHREILTLANAERALELRKRIDASQSSLLDDLVKQLKTNVREDLRDEFLDAFYQGHEEQLLELLQYQANFCDHGPAMEVLIFGLNDVLDIDTTDLKKLFESIEDGTSDHS